ncbi:ribosome small subunit-dependent GTPase A [Bacillus sp. CGMCC 1.16541]|uniref:ribosome small subunit-dependent GTPase A n=1 Tax=Bacillus sp. CGMCC 1.16541 TaxID=2185143 RepID=UPI000D72AEDC|nr:ribosome small subunit-dependent GTPase A [Bacillus sp. CGMCC 1.16541]
MNLKDIGSNETFKSFFNEYENQGYTIGRVTLEHKRLYRVVTDQGELLAEVSGKFRFESLSRQMFPTVGDWVVIKPRWDEKKATIQAVLPRKSKFSRKVAGEKTEEQLVATNIDVLFIVVALNHDFNIRRIERYMIMAWESGAKPVIILNKADLCLDIEEKLNEVENVAFGVPIHILSALNEESIPLLQQYAANGATIALVGSSGVGKSTITNRLIGKDVQYTQEVRDRDDRGRHTTTYRELMILPTGGCIIDTPGMRELQLWDASEGLQDVFEDIEHLASMCYFTNCRHQTEPKCAIKEAIEEGTLSEKRFQSYKKLQRELAYLAQKEDKAAAIQEKEKVKRKQIHKELKKKFNKR